MKVYLAAPYLARDALKPFADELDLIGMPVTSRWLTEPHEINAGTVGAATAVADADVRQHCHDDFRDIRTADVVVVFTGHAAAMLGDTELDDARLYTGGRHVETGYALAMRKQVIVVGQAENVFHRGACTVVPDWHRAVLELCAIARATETTDERAELAEGAF